MYANIIKMKFVKNKFLKISKFKWNLLGFLTLIYVIVILGVVETGLFIDMTDECLVGDPQGNVRLLKKTEQTLEL